MCNMITVVNKIMLYLVFMLNNKILVALATKKKNNKKKVLVDGYVYLLHFSNLQTRKSIGFSIGVLVPPCSVDSLLLGQKLKHENSSQLSLPVLI